MGRFFSVLGKAFAVLLQAIVGYLLGAVAGLGLAQGAMPASIIYMWAGMAAGIFLVGSLALLLRRALRVKKYLPRLIAVLAGTAIPLAILAAVGFSQGFDSPAINGGLGLLLPILAVVLGLVGFYAPGWLGAGMD